MDSVSSVVLNPTWTVPFSIFVKDKLPEIRKDIRFLDRLHMKVIDDVTGKQVDPSTIDWNGQTAENLKYTLVQSPGPGMPWVFIKFPLQNPYAIYLHDTDSRQLFGENLRLYSSGCVRLEKPFELAESLLNLPQWTAQDLQAATENLAFPAEKSTWLKIARPVPVYLIYQTLQIIEGRIVSLPDYYRLDEAAFDKMRN